MRERWEYGWAFDRGSYNWIAEHDTAEEALQATRGMRFNNTQANPAIRRITYDEPLVVKTNPCAQRPGGSQDIRHRASGFVQEVHLEHMRMRVAGMTEKEAWDALYEQETVDE